MRRIFLGIVLPILLVIAVGAVAWFIVRSRTTSSTNGTENGSIQAEDRLQVVSEPGADGPELTPERRALFGDGEPGTAADRATVSVEGTQTGVIIDEDSVRIVEIGSATTDEEPNQEDSTLVPIPSQTAGTGGAPVAPVISGSADEDGDGLTTDQELQLGTSPLRADTDNDGLSDGDEVRLYRTDPLNPDTDGDGYLDGAEVRAGYNPNGPGTL